MTARTPLRSPTTVLRPDLGLPDARGTLAPTVRRLVAEFPDRHVAVVSATVTRCLRDLAGTPPGALPELLERLARQRLLDSG